MRKAFWLLFALALALALPGAGAGSGVTRRDGDPYGAHPR
ncbi:Uncharacterised protein [Klebsiella pneumoniae subsp. rhinoscleromatis]|nr:Uncharacterised protein [Klebsiella pneumoniae subsp. rhinoscleromatis]